MLPRSQRLSVEQFNSVMEKGMIFHSPTLLMRVLKVEDSTKVSAVAPQKVVKGAVKRNKMRRKMYEAVRPLIGSISEGFYIIVFAKSGAIEADTTKLTDDMKAIFVKAKLLK